MDYFRNRTVARRPSVSTISSTWSRGSGSSGNSLFSNSNDSEASLKSFSSVTTTGSEEGQFGDITPWDFENFVPRSTECPVCHLHVSRVRDVKRHLQTHDPGAHFWQCQYFGCDYQSLQSSNVKAHVRTQHAHVTPHMCEDCGLCARDPSSLVDHRQKYHDLICRGPQNKFPRPTVVHPGTKIYHQPARSEERLQSSPNAVWGVSKDPVSPQVSSLISRPIRQAHTLAEHIFSDRYGRIVPPPAWATPGSRHQISADRSTTTDAALADADLLLAMRHQRA